MRVPMSWGTHDYRLSEKTRSPVTNSVTRPKLNALAVKHGLQRYLVHQSRPRPFPVGQNRWNNRIVADQVFIRLLRYGRRLVLVHPVRSLGHLVMGVRRPSAGVEDQPDDEGFVERRQTFLREFLWRYILANYQQNPIDQCRQMTRVGKKVDRRRIENDPIKCGGGLADEFL